MPETQGPTPERPHFNRDDILRAPIGGRVLALPSIDLGPVMEAVDAYNSNHDLGYTLGRLLLGVIRQVSEDAHQVPDDEERTGNAIQDLEQYHASAQEQLRAELIPTLAACGLGLGPLRSTAVIQSYEEKVECTPFGCFIDDPSLFGSYLESLNPSTMKPSQKRGLQSLLTSLCSQLNRDYELLNADDRLLSLVKAADPIAANYERLGIDSGRFTTVIDAIRGKYLRDLVRAQAYALDEPFKNEGFILLWHRDSTPSYLQEKWDATLDIILSLSANPAAHTLYAQARETASTALKHSIEEVSHWSESSSPRRQSVRDEFLVILRRIELRLTDL